MDRFFDDAFRSFKNGEAASRVLPMDVHETKDELVIEASVPGIRPEDVDVTLERGHLTIKASRTRPENGEAHRWLHREIWAGDYVRTFVLPDTLQDDKAQADIEQGVLTLHIPKAEVAKPRQIKVQPR